MTFLRIKIVDVDHKDKVVDISNITKIGAVVLIEECEQMLSDLKDKYYHED